MAAMNDLLARARRQRDRAEADLAKSRIDRARAQDRAATAEQRVEELEAALELIAGHGSEPYRDPAADLARLALYHSTPEGRERHVLYPPGTIPAVDTRDIDPTPEEEK